MNFWNIIFDIFEKQLDRGDYVNILMGIIQDYG